MSRAPEPASAPAATTGHVQLKTSRKSAQTEVPLPDLTEAILEDSPRNSRMLLWALAALVLSALLWANFAEVEEITRGQGKAIPPGKLQRIQNLEGGIVSEILVREGQIINQGDPLLRLDDTRFASNVQESRFERLGKMARLARLNAEMEERELLMPDEVISEAPELAAAELALHQARTNKLLNERSILDEQRQQRQQELDELKSRQQQFRNSLALLRQELNMSAPLVADGAISEVEVLRLRRAEVETRGNLDSVTLSIPRAESALREVEQRIEEVRNRFRGEALAELSQTRIDLEKTEASGLALEDRVRRTLVTSPVNGIVQQLLVNTIGGVIQPGSDLVEIIPLDDTLLFEARIRPQDIAFLHPGQQAMIKITAYDFTIYGGLKGELEHISADTVADDKGESYYLIRLRTDQNHLGTPENPLLIIPGMVASVDIITGKKSILSYLLKPVLRARAEALRER
ncbi:HlyD family type I secretion periplasmic adaptor subunit [Halopseudomonas yangmingensis]|uniref:Membrane fusion protein (MFP) family protein n=1 Tax=Halopseudomonas yangmingensis TaxID=1720063 RepID=A0A1I4NPK8_9GAMM|nr:membrane fusion protein, adhesin transport system [Halopseudomonas yangmingensis]